MRINFIEVVRDTLQSALELNEAFNEEVRIFLNNSCLDPFDFKDFWDLIMKDFIEVFMKGLPEYILTSKILTSFW